MANVVRESPRPPMFRRRLLGWFAALVALGGCSHVPPSNLTTDRID